MTTPPMFPGFDGLMTLSRREGVDIRPTLLRVLTDLYVQASTHTADEETQFAELASRLIEQVDDATLAVVRARLSIYPHTPAVIAAKLGLTAAPLPAAPAPRVIEPEWTLDAIATTPEPLPTAEPLPVSLPEEIIPHAPMLSMKARDAAEISTMFFAATSRERALILQNLAETPLRAAPRIPDDRAVPAIAALQMAAYAKDFENFAREISDVLLLTPELANQIISDPGGEPLACAMKALGMPSPIFQRVLMFLDPVAGSSVAYVYRLSRLYDVLNQRSALIMLAAWRGARLATTQRPKHQTMLYDDERQRARATPLQQASPSQMPAADVAWRNRK